MAVVSLVRFLEGRVAPGDPEAMVALVAPFVGDRVGAASLELVTSDGGALAVGILNGGSVMLNEVEGAEIWRLIWKLCDAGGIAAGTPAGTWFVVTSDEVRMELPEDLIEGSVVCTTPRSLRLTFEARSTATEAQVGEDGHRSFSGLDGPTSPRQLLSSERSIVERWPFEGMEFLVRADEREQRFVALSMLSRVWGGFLRPGDEGQLPDGLDSSFMAWLSAAWQAWADEHGWEGLDVASLGVYESALSGAEGAAMLRAYDLAGRFCDGSSITTQLALVVNLIDDELPGHVREAVVTDGQLRDVTIRALAADDLHMARVGVDVAAHLAECRRFNDSVRRAKPDS